MSTLLDQYIARLENIPSFNIHSVSNDGMTAKPWYEVTSDGVVRELVLDEINLAHQVQTITGEIQKWGRLVAQCRRVWEMKERDYRSWRSQIMLDLMTPPAEGEDKTGWTVTAKGDPKPPTKEVSDALKRIHPDYAKTYVAIERAEEAYHSTEAVYEAFKAKRDMLKRFAFRHHDSGDVQLSV